MGCYEYGDKCLEASAEGQKVLFGIDKLSNNTNPKPKELALPRQGPNNTNEKAAMLVLKVCMMILRFFLSGSNNKGYENILLIIDQLTPWFRYIGQDNKKKMQLWFTTFLRDCTLSLVEKRDLKDKSLINRFIAETVLKYGNASMNDEMFKFGQDICSSYFSKLDDEYFLQANITDVVLESIAGQYKNHAEREHTLNKFMQLVLYCTVNHSVSTINHCSRVASFYSKLAAKYFPEVVDVEFCALVLVINDLDSWKTWYESKNTQDGMKISIPNLLTQLKLYLKKLTHINLLERSAISTCFIERLSSMILCNCNEIISGVESYLDPVDLQSTSIEIVFSGFIDDFFANCYSERKEHIDKKKIKLIVEVAVASLILSLMTTKQVIERPNTLEKLMMESPFQAIAQKFLFEYLHKASIAMFNADKIDEALQLLKPCCEVAWKRVLNFCKMLNSSKREGSSDLSDFSDESIIGCVKIACEDSAQYLSILRDYHLADLNSSLGTFVNEWIIAQNEFGIMSPVALVKGWVQIQCEESEGKDQEAWDKVPTIYSLVSSSTEYGQYLGIILEQELGMYKEYENNREFCSVMEMNYEKIVVKIIDGEYRLNRCKNLIDCGMHLGTCGCKGQIDGIAYISEALKIMNQMDLKAKKKFGHDLLCLLYFRAYCSLALYKRIVYPSSKDFIEDVDNAFKHLSKLNDSKHLSEIDIDYFFFVADLLSLEGYTTRHAGIYKIMIGIVSSSDTLNGFMDIALQSGNLSHIICGSPINEALIKTLMSNNSHFDDVSSWENCMKLNSTKVVFEQNLSILPTLSSLDSFDAHATKIDDIIRKVKNTASSLITSTTEPHDSFVAARLSYDLAQRLIAKGSMVEALRYAYDGYRLRKKLLFQCFAITREKSKRHANVDGNIVDIKRYVNKTLDLHASRVLPSGSYGFQENQCVYFPTPWNLVKCYLESALQVGTIEAMNGNGDKAESILLSGKEISSLFDLPIYVVGFCTTLGKIYHKKHWKLAEQELRCARHQLDGMCSSISCEKCKSVLKVTLNQQLGDISISFVKDLVENNVTADAFVVEQASILYKISRFSLKCFYTKREEAIFSKPTVMAGLKLAFILSSEVPTLYRKVSHLIAILYARSYIDEAFSLSSSTLNAPLASQWATYFHQASIGAYVNRPFLEHMVDNHRFALVPPSVKELESSVLKFFKLLPSVSILCISILTDKSDQLLGDLLPNSPYSTWIMLSRMNSNTGPVIIILPVGKTFTDFPYTKDSSVSDRRCTWANNEMDKLAPVLKCILEEDRKVRAGQDYPSLGKDKRISLNKIFKNFLSDLKNSWFGSWKHLLLGKQSDNNCHDVDISTIKKKLKNECGLDSHDSYLRMAIEGDWHKCEEKEFIAWLILTNGCVIAKSGGEIHNIDSNRLASIITIIGTAVGKSEKMTSTCGEPVILVLDLSIQMIPWENLPKLRQQEVYRMPSVGVIIYSIFKERHNVGGIPAIDPQKCCYFVNPTGEFKTSETFVRELCAKLDLQGNILNNATKDDLISDLKTLDILVYLGHGDGRQYIPSKEIRKMSKCAATVLLGCDSGYIFFNKTCTPDGAALDYILAGSPIVVGNLWSVYSDDDHPLIRVLFEAWVKATLARVVECTNNNLRKRKLHDKDSEISPEELLCKHKVNLASSIPEARQACTPLEYVMGASPVIYGIPTCIVRKDLTCINRKIYDT